MVVLFVFSVVDLCWVVKFEVVVCVVGCGFWVLYDVLLVVECLWGWSMVECIVNVVECGILVLVELYVEFLIDSFVVCYGDVCLLNILFDDDGELVGFVDFVVFGVVDCWVDIVVVLMSMLWNYGFGWEDVFIEVYGVEFDCE